MWQKVFVPRRTANTSFQMFMCTLWFTAAFKEKGNEAYAQEDYDSAVKYYSHGLAELRDVQQLYTNRAQV